MRVGSESRAWEQGKVLLFDDSYEHEVRNRCSTKRVVLQVVVGHPSVRLKGPLPLVTEEQQLPSSMRWLGRAQGLRS